VSKIFKTEEITDDGVGSWLGERRWKITPLGTPSATAVLAELNKTFAESIEGRLVLKPNPNTFKRWLLDNPGKEFRVTTVKDLCASGGNFTIQPNQAIPRRKQ